MARTYRDLIVWQKAMRLAEAAYVVANLLPGIERFGLAAQMRRASISIPSNIAEGHERRSRADYRRFITMACGSLAELETQIELSCRLYGVDEKAVGPVIDLSEEIGRLLRAIERSLRARSTAAQSSPQPSALSPDP